MDDQFDESNIYLDDPETEYYCSPFTKSTGFNKLQKLIMYNHRVNQYDQIVELIVDHPELINQQNTNGWTSLMLAVRNANKYNMFEVVELLVAHRVSSDIGINLQCIDGWTALMHAARYSDTDSNVETVRLLLKHPGVDIQLQNSHGWSALMLAGGAKSRVAFQLLIDAGALINTQKKNGVTAYNLTDDEYIRFMIRHTVLKSIGANGRHKNKDCSICIQTASDDDIDNYVGLQCGHYFHYNCVSEWLFANQTCPVCRFVLY